MKIKFINPAVIVAAMLVSIGFCRSEALDPTAFTKRMPITFSGYSGATPIANFPVLIKLSEGIAGFSYEKFSQGGTNLRFADNSGQALDYEIDTWNSNGTSTAWVRIPELTAGTKIYAYWGATFTEHAPSHSNGAVWSPSSHAGVWHFSTIPGGVTTDSTIEALAKPLGILETGGCRRLGASRHFSDSGDFAGPKGEWARAKGLRGLREAE